MKPKLLLLIAILSFKAIFSQTADIILTNGKIFTSNTKKLYAEAIAIKGNRVVAVGNTKTIDKLKRPTTKAIDLKGKTVVPGFNDAHYHHNPYTLGYNISFPEDGTEPTWQQLKDSITLAVKQQPKGTFINATMGIDVGTDTSINRTVLDKLAPDHPLMINAYWGHVTYFNTAAIEVFGISETEPDPKGGFFGRFPGTQKLNGRAYEHACNVLRLRRPSNEKLLLASLADLSKEALHFGITSIIVVQNPTHFTIGPLLQQRYEPQLLQNAAAMKSLLQAGIPVALGSDGPLNPYLNIMFACMHPFREDEALTVEQAVIAYTKTAAYAEMQDDKGILAAGQLADLVVLSQDIFTVPLQELPTTSSVLTMVDGKIVYSKL